MKKPIYITILGFIRITITEQISYIKIFNFGIERYSSGGEKHLAFFRD